MINAVSPNTTGCFTQSVWPLKVFMGLFSITLSLTGCKNAQPTQSATTLEGTTWILAEVNGEPLITPADARAVHFVLDGLDGKNQLHGYAGCNNITGSYRLVRSASISFTVASTRMMCSQDKMEIEQFFLDALSHTDGYSLKGKTLLLLDGETALAKFLGAQH